MEDEDKQEKDGQERERELTIAEVKLLGTKENTAGAEKLMEILESTKGLPVPRSH